MYLFICDSVHSDVSKHLYAMGCKMGKSDTVRRHSLRNEFDPEKTVRAVLLIQRWFRRYKLRMKLRARATWEIFRHIELSDSQDQARLFNFFNILLEEMEVHVGRRSVALSEIFNDTTVQPDFDNDEYFYNYKGPHLQLPIDKNQLDRVLMFISNPKNILHPKSVYIVLRAAATRLEALPNINICSTSIAKQMTVVGDLHGQLQDLLTIFNKNNLPGSNNPYIFNGDYVDRGSKGIEVLILVLAFFLAYPHAVFINRGNHEDLLMNERYGFIRELKSKYGPNAKVLTSAIEDVYKHMPLATLLNNKVFIVHGGISQRINMMSLRNLKRSCFGSVLYPPPVLIDDVAYLTSAWEIVFDLLWSDPHDNLGSIENNLRGAGSRWGTDITANFLIENKLEYIIRSHQCKIEGYDVCHFSKVITIFSASNYYAPGSNKGAYIKMDSTLECFFMPYIVSKVKYVGMTAKEKLDVIEEAAIRDLFIRLYQNRMKLLEEFQKYDNLKIGMIKSDEWCTCMQKISKLHLPWLLLIEKMAPQPEFYEGEPFPEDMVSYLSTMQLLEDEDIVNGFKVKVELAATLYKNRHVLEAIFNIIDTDNSGTITVEELTVFWKIYSKHLTEEETIEDAQRLMELMDFNHDGEINFNEFLEAFRLSQKRFDVDEH